MNRRIRGKINSGEVGALYDNGRICGTGLCTIVS